LCLRDFQVVLEAYLFKHIDFNAGVQIHYWQPSDQKYTLW